jgi:hypothetical protein
MESRINTPGTGFKRNHIVAYRLRTNVAQAVRVLVLLSILFIVACRQSEQDMDGQLPSTGFVVLEEFAPYYERYGETLLGEPISGACELAGGGVAQYFQRMRLELDEESQEVELYPLGEWAHAGLSQIEATPDNFTDRQRHFPQTGHFVQDEFLTFYEENDGETLLGPPVSPPIDEGELLVQYFRNGRLEWHPDAPRAQRVQVGMLGRAHYAQAAQDVSCEIRARPVEVGVASEVQIQASVSRPILYEGEQQVVYATVTTPAGVPVSHVPVQVTVRGPGGSQTLDLGQTDAEGHVAGVLEELPDYEPGSKVSLEITAHGADGAVTGSSSLAFQTWW